MSIAYFPRMSAADMLAINKHYQQAPDASFGEVVLFPYELRAEHSLPLTDAAVLVVDVVVAVDSDYIQIHVHTDAGAQSWIRMPERRNLARRDETARHLREVAILSNLPAFLSYISDCGFTRQ